MYFCSECLEECKATRKRLGARGQGLRLLQSRDKEIVQISDCCEAEAIPIDTVLCAIDPECS